MKACVNASGPKKGKLKKGYKFGKGGACRKVGGGAKKRASSGGPLAFCVHRSGAKKGKLKKGYKFGSGGRCIRTATWKSESRGKVQYGPTRAHFIEPADVSHLPLDGRRRRRRSRRRHLMGLGRMHYRVRPSRRRYF